MINRRAFLAASASAGIGAPFAAAAFAPLPVPQGLTRSRLPTPALLLDLDCFEANLKTVADLCKRTGCGYRPHAKTHKCPEIAKRQVASGALGVCVATVPEAEAMVAAGLRGMLLTSPIIEPVKVERMLALARQDKDLMLAVGDPRQVSMLAKAAKAAGQTCNVLIDVDVGDRRTGVVPDRALALARLIAKNKSLQLRGVQAYAGHASHTVGFENRTKVSRKAMQIAVDTKQSLTRAGFELPILSGGSTGTYNIDAGIQGVTELQVGSYVFMDVGYRSIGSKTGDTYTDFKPSLTVLTTVVSAAHPDRVTADAGTKSFSTDGRNVPESKQDKNILYRRGGDEFGIITASEGGKLPQLGDRLEFIIPHCDPTVNLYDRLYAVRGEAVEGIWPILARKENIV